MVARYGQKRRPQSIYKGLCRTKLAGPCALRDVAREHHQIGMLLRSQRDKCVDHRRQFSTEMRIGNMQHDTHAGNSEPVAVAA